MFVKLRDYQEALISNTRAALRRTKKVLLQAPTGAGKTALGTHMTGTSAQRGFRTWFVVHRQELIEQTSKTFARFGVSHSFIAAGRPYDPAALVHICSIDTLKRRLSSIESKPHFVIWDECHHIAAAGWTAVFEALAGSYHVGLSATPIRTDGSGLDSHFDEMVLGPAVSWLIENGHLSKYRAFAPAAPDLSGVKKAMGDYATGQLADVMDKPKLTGDIVQHWQRHCAGMRTCGFAVNVKHSQSIVQAFIDAGIPAAHLDGETPAVERADIIRRYADGEILVLWNVGLFGEGFDLSAIAGRDVTIDAVILARPTQSLALHLQQVGRALRPAPGKVAIILDHAGNSFRHGLPDDERTWKLQGTEKKLRGDDDALPPPITCKCCFGQIRRPAPPACPICGEAIVAESAPLPQQSKAELREIDRAAREAARLAKEEARAASKLAKELEAARLKEERAAAKVAKAAAKAIKEAEEKAQQLAAAAKRKSEERACKSFDELVALGISRGYKDAAYWAEQKFATRPNYRRSF